MPLETTGYIFDNDISERERERERALLGTIAGHTLDNHIWIHSSMTLETTGYIFDNDIWTHIR